ncbi:EGF-like domain [Trinorchestia longiramus]|nr:EGF-like domain [Trinorchestia longiramus]
MLLLVVFMCSLFSGNCHENSAHSNHVFHNFKNRPQPPPFSPSLERLIHNDLESQITSKKENTSYKSLPIRGQQDIESPIADSVHSFHEKEISTTKPINKENEGKSPGWASFANRFQSAALSDKTVSVGTATTKRSILEDSGSNRGSSHSEDNVQTQRSVFDFDNPFGSKRENCPPPLEPGHLRWRKGSNFVTASLPHLASESCRPPVKCSFSTTVHRRVFVQDGDTLQVLLQVTDEAQENHPVYTLPTAASGQPTSNFKAETIVTSSSLSSTEHKVEPDNTEQVTPPAVAVIKVDPTAGGTPNSFLRNWPSVTKSSIYFGDETRLEQEQKEKEEAMEMSMNLKLTDISQHSEANKAKTTKPDGKPSKLSARLQPVTLEGKNEETAARVVSAPSHSKMPPLSYQPNSRDLKISTPTREHTSSNDQKRVSSKTQTSSDTESPPNSQTVVVPTQSLIHKQKRASDDAKIHAGSDDELADAADPQSMVLPKISSLTLWKVSVSEWVSCSTREGGQVAQSGPDGIATLTPRDLQPGTTYFIGRSSWSSSECFKLQVSVRSAECGEGSLCSGKGTCHANSSMEHFQCACCPDYMGSHCEERDACHHRPCLNDGICVDIQEGHDGDTFQCLCPYESSSDSLHQESKHGQIQRAEQQFPQKGRKTI